jgi:hypothetical protein
MALTDRSRDLQRLAWVLAAGLVYAFVFVTRYQGLWTENDTTYFTRDAALAVQRHTVLYAGAYPHGFLYTAWLASFQWIAGVPPAVFNTIIAPYVGATMMLLAAYLCFRALTGSGSIATLATWMLLAVPDLMFSALRGNHEKFSITFMLMGLYALGAETRPRPTVGPGGVRARRALDRSARRRWMALFVLIMLMNAVTNDYFASLLAAAGLVAAGVMALVSLFLRQPSGTKALARLLALAMGAAGVLVIWVMTVVYPAAGQDFNLLQTAMAKLIHLLITLHASSNPYSAPAAQWAGALAYALASSFRWIMFGASLGVAGVWFARMARRRRASSRHVMLLALYMAFGFLVAVAIPLDFTGLAAGTNLEVRNFTYFALLAAPVTAVGIWALWTRGRWSRPGRVWSMRTAVVVGLFITAGVLKATLDPLVSNEWIYYTPQERQAVAFFLTHARGQGLWAGPDNRLAYMAQSLYPDAPHGNLVEGFRPVALTRDFLWSPVLVASARAEDAPLPVYSTEDRVYDNGGAAVYQIVWTNPTQP